MTRHVNEVAAEFATAAAVLNTATRSWPILPPATTAQIDAVENQLEGLRLRRSLGDMRIALKPRNGNG